MFLLSRHFHHIPSFISLPISRSILLFFASIFSSFRHFEFYTEFLFPVHFCLFYFSFILCLLFFFSPVSFMFSFINIVFSFSFFYLLFSFKSFLSNFLFFIVHPFFLPPFLTFCYTVHSLPRHFFSSRLFFFNAIFLFFYTFHFFFLLLFAFLIDRKICEHFDQDTCLQFAIGSIFFFSHFSLSFIELLSLPEFYQILASVICIVFIG
ncbi:unnamed protein product [Acanthosepion pharaonis]|uniref:Uncharacterized protein n=1 Tax=Acanthosepion pharaonis TaxID=158019 RepID=A0A812BL81_ACAPH|nr:unnamed protein product [Sepia pharaonis]